MAHCIDSTAPFTPKHKVSHLDHVALNPRQHCPWRRREGSGGKQVVQAARKTPCPKHTHLLFPIFELFAVAIYRHTDVVTAAE